MNRILLIDDDDGFRTPMRIALERVGYNVKEARCGKDGLAIYRAQTYHLVILELILHDMDGLRIVAELREESSRLKILAITGGSREEPQGQLAEAKSRGASRILAKPFSAAQFVSTVRELLVATDPVAESSTDSPKAS